METLHKRVAGIHVHRMKQVVSVLVEDDSGQPIKEQREFGGFKRDVKALAAWLRENKAPRRNQRGIDGALQTAGFQPAFAPRSQELNPQRSINHEVIVNLIGSTTTQNGLAINAELDTDLYPKGIRISDEELESVNLTKATFHGKWNYATAQNCSG